jgi:hypothetical protein
MGQRKRAAEHDNESPPLHVALAKPEPRGKTTTSRRGLGQPVQSWPHRRGSLGLAPANAGFEFQPPRLGLGRANGPQLSSIIALSSNMQDSGNNLRCMDIDVLRAQASTAPWTLNLKQTKSKET